MVCREVSKSCVVLQNRVGVMKPFCMEISCSVKLRAFYKELQPVRFAYGFSALFIPALERGLHESHRPTSLHGLLQLRRAFRDGLASRLCFHEAAQEQKPFPPRQAGRQPSSRAAPFCSTPLTHQGLRGKASGEKCFKGNILPRVHHLTCLQHPEQPGQGYSPLHHHQQPGGASTGPACSHLQHALSSTGHCLGQHFQLCPPHVPPERAPACSNTLKAQGREV